LPHTTILRKELKKGWDDTIMWSVGDKVKWAGKDEYGICGTVVRVHPDNIHLVKIHWDTDKPRSFATYRSDDKNIQSGPYTDFAERIKERLG